MSVEDVKSFLGLKEIVLITEIGRLQVPLAQKAISFILPLKASKPVAKRWIPFSDGKTETSHEKAGKLWHL